MTKTQLIARLGTEELNTILRDLEHDAFDDDASSTDVAAYFFSAESLTDVREKLLNFSDCVETLKSLGFVDDRMFKTASGNTRHSLVKGRTRVVWVDEGAGDRNFKLIQFDGDRRCCVCWDVDFSVETPSQVIVAAVVAATDETI